MKVAVLAFMATMGGAFVAPGAQANICGRDGDKMPGARSTPASRGEASAVAPLQISGFSLSGITDLFSRECVLYRLRLYVMSFGRRRACYLTIRLLCYVRSWNYGHASLGDCAQDFAPCLNVVAVLLAAILDVSCAGDREGVTSLPQDPNADQAKRKKQLEEKQKDYRWSTKVRRMT